MASSTVYQIVTDEIIKKLEAGHVPWRKPWKTFGAPRNLISGKPYRGINAFLLSCSPFSSPFWLTFRQADGLGGHVRKGEHSSIAVFWKEWETEKQTDTGETVEVKIPILRYYRVFNSEQCEGIDHKRLAELQALESAGNAFNPIEQAEAVMHRMPNPPHVTEAESRAFYRPSTDTVNLPKRGLFDSPEEYYATAFHELSHSTGHASRLNRKGITEHHFFGDADYGQEELVAEMASAFLCGECRISQPVIDNQAAYIGGWLRTIRKDAKLVVVAASQGQKAADYILGKGGREP
jgi:antirestriction protein ArdC